MNKTLLYAKWFCENNHRINKELLNKLCYYTNVMIAVVNFKMNTSDNLTSEEIKILKIINRVFGYADLNDLQIEYSYNFIEKMKKLNPDNVTYYISRDIDGILEVY